jgi:hypothetical protein
LRIDSNTAGDWRADTNHSPPATADPIAIAIHRVLGVAEQDRFLFTLLCRSHDGYGPVMQ